MPQQGNGAPDVEPRPPYQRRTPEPTPEMVARRQAMEQERMAEAVENDRQNRIVQAGIKGQPMPTPTREQYEAERAFKEAAKRKEAERAALVTAAERGPDIVQKRAVDPAIDFMSRINDAAALLADIGGELGNVGKDDMHALQSYAQALQDNVRRYIGSLIERKRRELADLERVLGRL